MAYAEDRFYKSAAQFEGADGHVRQAAVYTYDSHTTLYEVLLIEESKFVRTNCGALSNLISDWTPAHYAIEHHFSL